MTDLGPASERGSYDAPAIDLDAWLECLRSRLRADAVLDPRCDDVSGYERGWRYGQGRALCVVRPSTVEDVEWVIREARARDLVVHPIGANTGLVGASNPDASGRATVLSFERLREIVAIDPIDRTAVVEAGVTLSQLNAAAAEHGLWFPIDLGADPQVGGMVATNTGGTRLLRYGDVRRNLLGLEVILHGGRRIGGLRRLRKDNTGLDLKQLFVGTSGAYGFVTRAVLQLAPRPSQTAAALCALRDGAAAMPLLHRLERALGDALTAFEVISRNALLPTLAHSPGLKNPFGGELPAYAVLVEVASTLPIGAVDLEEVLQTELVAHFEADPDCGVEDVMIDQAEVFWSLRHHISESLAVAHDVLAFDVSVPRSRLPEFTEAVRDLLSARQDEVHVCDFGHWGDGGTHLNLCWARGRVSDADRPQFVAELQELVYDLCVQKFEGSFSAEHGVGPHNQRFYDRYVSGEQRALIERIERAVNG